MNHAAVQPELRSVAGTEEVLQAVVVVVRAAEVRAGDRERLQSPVIAYEVAAEGGIARSVRLTAVRHRERHAGGRVEKRGAALGYVRHRRLQRHAYLDFALVRVARRKEVDPNGGGDCGDCGREQAADPPAEKGSSSRLLGTHRANRY